MELENVTLRRYLLQELVRTFPLRFSADALRLRAGRAQVLDHAPSLDAVVQALAFLEGEKFEGQPILDHQFDPMGGSEKYYGATSSGVKHMERAF